MKNISNFENFGHILLEKQVPVGYWTKEMEAALPLEIMALMKAANPGMDKKELAKKLVGVFELAGLLVKGKTEKETEESIFMMLRHMEKTDAQISSMKEETPKQKGLKTQSIIAQDVYRKTKAKISAFKKSFKDASKHFEDVEE